MNIFKVILLVVFIIYASDRKVFCSFTTNSSLWWPEGYVHYEFAPGFSQEHIDIIFKIMLQIQRQTCILFIPASEQRPSPDDMVKLLYTWNPNLLGCITEVGRVIPEDRFTKVTQKITFGPYCLDTEIGTAPTFIPIMNALGFYHESQRRDRECYIVIEKSYKLHAYQFEVTWDADFTFPYDYWTVMQIRKAYTPVKNIPGHKAIAVERHRPGPPPDGGLSELDVMTLNYVYCGLRHPCLEPKDPSGLWSIRDQCEEEDEYEQRTKCIISM